MRLKKSFNSILNDFLFFFISSYSIAKIIFDTFFKDSINFKLLKLHFNEHMYAIIEKNLH